MTTLLNVVITAAVPAGLSNVFHFPDGPPRNLVAELQVGGTAAAGTSIDAYLQTSIDQGASWCDIAQLHVVNTPVKNLVNLSGGTPVTTPYVPTDGALTANTTKDGLLGPEYRVKYVTVGTYSGTTTLRVDILGSKSRLQLK